MCFNQCGYWTTCTEVFGVSKNFTCGCMSGYGSSSGNRNCTKSCGTTGANCGYNATCISSGASGSPLCACNTGYVSPTNDGTNCVPVNNCAVNNGGCQQICTYVAPSSSVCSCKDGYVLNADNRTCSLITTTTVTTTTKAAGATAFMRSSLFLPFCTL